MSNQSKLIVAKRKGGKIIIGGDIEIDILAIDHQQVKIGITTPDDINVVREQKVTTLPARKNHRFVTGVLICLMFSLTVFVAVVATF